MARLVLHIGTHKTGTTMLQDTFHANRALLARHGVIYPALGKHTGHHGLLTDWLKLPPAYNLPAGGIATLKLMAERLADTDKTLFLSSEEFSRGGGSGGQVDMAALGQIARRFEQVTVICVLREQWQFLQSVYLEVARTRTPDRPPEMIEKAFETGMVDGLWCDYNALYDHILNGFDPAAVQFFDYSSTVRAEGGILATVLNLLGTSLNVGDLTLVNGGKSNVSARPLSTWAGFAIAGGHNASSQLMAACETAFNLEFGPRPDTCLFTRTERAAISDHFVPRNQRLAARINQPGFAVRQTQSLPSMMHRDDVTPDYWLRAARRIYLGTLGA